MNKNIRGKVRELIENHVQNYLDEDGGMYYKDLDYEINPQYIIDQISCQIGQLTDDEKEEIRFRFNDFGQ